MFIIKKNVTQESEKNSVFDRKIFVIFDLFISVISLTISKLPREKTQFKLIEKESKEAKETLINILSQ